MREVFLRSFSAEFGEREFCFGTTNRGLCRLLELQGLWILIDRKGSLVCSKECTAAETLLVGLETITGPEFAELRHSPRSAHLERMQPQHYSAEGYQKKTYRHHQHEPSPTLRLVIEDVVHQTKHTLRVPPWATIQTVKARIHARTSIAPHLQRLYCGTHELPNRRLVQEAGTRLRLDYRTFSSSSSAASSWELRLATTRKPPQSLQAAMTAAQRGLGLGLKPQFSVEGTGGTYFLLAPNRTPVCVFKPADEEPYAPHNPKGYLGSGLQMRSGIAPGESCLREVAAHVLDHQHTFAGVPPTCLVEARHDAFHSNGTRLTTAQGGAALGAHSIQTKNTSSTTTPPRKLGSLQQFVHADCTMDDLSPSLLTVEQVHVLAIHDIRLLNADRNVSNVLVRKNHPDDNHNHDTTTTTTSFTLIPIDHGYCLRTVADVSWMDWCWLDWPQLKQPVSEAHKTYVENLDIAKDVQLLQDLGLPLQACDYFFASTLLLKCGLRAGLTLYEIATLACRHDDLAQDASMMEDLLRVSTELAQAALENERPLAAAQAIWGQLTPQKASTGPMLKSLSAAAFGTTRLFQQDDDDDEENHYDKQEASFPLLEDNHQQETDMAEFMEDLKEVPDQAHSSSSDSTTCVNEWAANLLADVHIGTPRNHRSASIDSEATPESAGFWTVRPGTAVSPPVEWSPTSSSSSRTPADEIMEEGAPELPSLPKKVTIQEPPPKLPSPPPHTVHVVRRSKSYSALGNCLHTTTRAVHRDSPDFRAHWIPFVELVIEHHVASKVAAQEQQQQQQPPQQQQPSFGR